MSLGLVVSPEFNPSVDEVRELRPSFIRSIIYSMDDIEPLLAYHLPLLITLNNQAQEVGPDWSGWDVAVEMVAERGHGQVFGLAVGNEFDLWWQNDPSNVPPAFAADLVRRASAILRPRGIKTVATSVVGRDWQAYLEQMATLCRDEADYFDIHPYGQRPDGWGTPGAWMHGDLRPTLIRARELAGKPVICSEYGVKIGDAGGGGQVAAFLTAGAVTIAALGDAVCPYVAWFAWTDAVGAPSERGQAAFGLMSDDGYRRPAWHAFAALADAPPKVVEPPVVEVPPVVDPIPPEVPTVYPWQYFDAGAIEAASECPGENILVHWPKIVAQLELCGINDRATQIAALGTVAIETAGQFAPVREAFWLDEEWRRANLRYFPWYGRGTIQLTWRENYESFGRKVDDLWGAGGAIDLIARPDDALDPDISAAVLAVYFRDHGGDGLCLIPEAARRGDWREVRRLVQGADAGLDRLIAIANALSGETAPVEQPSAGDPRDQTIADLTLALRTLRDETLPAAAAQVAEAQRIVEQFVGSRG